MQRATLRLVTTFAVALALAGCSGSGLDGLMGGAKVAETPTLKASDREVSGKKLVAMPRHGTPRFADARAVAAAPPPPPAATAPAPAPAALPEAAAPTTAMLGVAATAENLFDVVPVLWGTDRKMPAAAASPTAAAPGGAGSSDITTGSVPKSIFPGPDRGDGLTLGRALVTIPRVAREKGDIPRPRHITFLNYTIENEDPRKHFTIGRFETLGEWQFTQYADEQLNGAERFEGTALVYIHGYNSTFEYSLYRAAQISHDLGFDGVPYLYSWPSRGSEQSYLYDEDSAARAQRFLAEFLDIIANKTKAKRIHIIAHSMGNRPLLEALKGIARTPRTARRYRIDQLILAAPDVDRDVFLEIAKSVTPAAKGITLYAMRNDRALQASRTVRGVPRAGDVPAGGPVIVAGVDSIDISDAGTNSYFSLNHSTYAERPHVLADISSLLRTGTRPPHQRFPAYREEAGERGIYWKYVKN